MTPEVAQFSNRGMNQDISVSKATNEFVFENYNIRITAVNDNTLLSITNEKLPTNIPVEINNKEIPNKITWGSKINISNNTVFMGFMSEYNVESDITVNYTIANINTGETENNTTVIKVGTNKSEDDVLLPINSELTYSVSPQSDDRMYYYTKDDELSESEKNYSIRGVYLGHAILNNYLVLFTKALEDKYPDFIYVLTYDKGVLKGDIKYRGDLNFQLDKPIETLPYYESELVQKVYWVDGVNQPRVINIVSDNIVERLDTQFDFNPTITEFPYVTITKEYSGVGLFPAGVIQYFISYYNKYGAETGIVWSSDLHYVTEYNRAVGPDETVVCNFKIDISNVDTTYDYARVYSMQRTSLNTTPICRIVGDININNSDSITIIDTNTNTETIDPTQLLFLGGDNFIASTLTQKDDVLFLGDLTIDNIEVPQEIKDLFAIPEGKTKLDYLRSETISTNNNTYKSFKRGEWYRVGIQFQDNTTRWTVPIFIGDIQIDVYSIEKDRVPIITFDIYHMFEHDEEAKNLLSRYSNYRLLMVETNSSNRSILAQGVVNPTVFNLKDRLEGRTYSIGSWISRPRGSNVMSEHLGGLGNDYEEIDGKYVYTNLDSCEIQNTFNDPPKEFLHYYTISFRKWDNRSLIVEIIELKESYTNSLPIEVDTFSTKVKKSIFKSTVYSNNVPPYAGVINKETVDEAKRVIQVQLPGVELNISSEFVVNLLNNYDSSVNTVNTIVSDTESWYWGHPSVKDPIEESTIEQSRCFYTSVDYNNSSEETNQYYVDNSILTFNSPDISNIKAIINDSMFKFRFVGAAFMHKVESDINVNLKSSGTTTTSSVLSHNNNGKYLINSALYRDKKLDKESISEDFVNYYLYLWNKKGSIIGQTANTIIDNNTNTLYAELEHKIIANKSIFDEVIYFNDKNTYQTIPIVFDSDNIQTLRLNVLGNNKFYQGNYDAVTAFSNTPYKSFWKTDFGVDGYSSFYNQVDPVSIKYNKLPHIVFSLEDGVDSYILPYIKTLKETQWKSEYVKYSNNQTLQSNAVFSWLNNKSYKQNFIEEKLLSERENTPYLFVGEFYRDVDSTVLYGEPTQNNLEKHVWIPISKALSIEAHLQNPISYNTQGDTYYQRWECLNTVPSTEEDLNSVVDIVSFMVETHVNLEGRYDKNKDSLNILNARPDNFNKINPVYSQTNNYFTYNILDEKFNQNKYFNQVAFSLQKTPTSEIDTWCNISLASTFNLDGKYGKLNKLITVNDAIIAFQDKALSVINFNNRTAISTENGVPIEIANSGKVNGYSVISSNVGCQNKLSICEASSGVYFIDDLNKTMYGFNKEGLSNISSKGMSMWFKKNLTGKEKCFYDKLTNDVYITNENNCLVYNETLDAFTSFMDYKRIHSLFNFEGKSMLFNFDPDVVDPQLMFNGKYTNNYYIQYKINPEPLTDKTFTNIEYIADCLDEQDVIDSDSVQLSINDKPFKLLEVWNEYQKGSTDLTTYRFRYPNSEKKFRINRVDIPRAGYNNRDRIRNPWIYLKLSKTGGFNNNKMVFHSFLVKYYK